VLLFCGHRGVVKTHVYSFCEVTISGARIGPIYQGAPICHKHGGRKAGRIMMLDRVSADQTDAEGEI
jgi:hypothetical protein